MMTSMLRLRTTGKPCELNWECPRLVDQNWSLITVGMPIDTKVSIDTFVQ
jgi:hypothetical protein